MLTDAMTLMRDFYWLITSSTHEKVKSHRRGIVGGREDCQWKYDWWVTDAAR